MQLTTMFRFGLLLALAACSSKGHDTEPPRDGGAFDAALAKADGSSPAGPTRYCGLNDATSCICDTQPGGGFVAGASCNQNTVPSPSLCCTTAQYPADDDICSCSQIFCVQDLAGDVCQCGFLAPDPTQGDKPMSSCTGKICCNSPSTIAPTCTCYTDLDGCPTGDEVVPSCGPSQVMCDQVTVTSCN